MANLIPAAIADFETQLSAAISAGATSFTIASATDDDGVSLPAGKYCFTVNNGSSNKQYLLGQLNGTSVTSVVSVSRQGAETSGAAFAARAGSPVIISDFATIQRVADILRGILTLDGSNPIVYDAEPTLADRKELATVGYVLDTVSGGTVAFDEQVIAGNGGESIVAGDLIYFNTSDQEWYKTDADTAATVNGVQIGIALGSGSNGVSITNGVQIAGTWTTTGLTAGSLYYASNTAGAISSSTGTTARVIGIALSTTKLLLIPRTPRSLTDGAEAATAGGGNFGTPGSSNKFITEAYNASASGIPVVRTYTTSGSPHTWTKPTGLKYIIVEAVGGGGGGAGYDTGNTGGAAPSGSGGGYCKKLIAAASLGTTETVTIGAAGTGGDSQTTPTSGTSGGNTTFGSHITAGGGGGATTGATDPGAAGTATGGDINIPGSRGSSLNTYSTTQTSFGGDSMLGFGSAWNNSSSYNGTGYGYGGAGGVDNDARDGLNGGPGYCIVTEYYS